MSKPQGIPQLGSVSFLFFLRGRELDPHEGMNLEQYILADVEGVESVRQESPSQYRVVVADNKLANIRDLRTAVIQSAYDFQVLFPPKTTR